MRERPNCPNCGAPITGALCDFCGTVFYDFANIELNANSFIRMRINNQIIMFKARTEQIEIKATRGKETFYADGEIFEIAKSPEYDINVKFHVEPDDKGIIWTKTMIKEES